MYASPKYLEQHGTPATIQELANHHFIAFSRPEILPYADLEWFLNSEMPTEKNRICKFRVNSVEMHFKAAEEGLGIIASYDDMSITKKSNLVKVLPDFKGPKYKEHFVYPKKIKNLQKIKTFKNFLIEQFREKRY